MPQVADIDMRSIAEEINFDFSRFTTASEDERNQEWFQNDIANRFSDWARELEETFEHGTPPSLSYTSRGSISCHDLSPP